ncbi:MAG: hypothetical protein R6U01_02655 [Halorubrum sp.]|uniref:hypothetical protein n=1 Tax=Halorubrum sp. TaxID=1879286 RepID=UPI003970F563
MGAETESAPVSPLEDPATWTVGLVRRTGFAVRASLGRRDGRATFAVVSTAYFLAYAVGLDHLGLRGGAAGVGSGRSPTVDVAVASDPLALLTRRVAPFQYEPVALVTLGPFEYLFVPVNGALGLGLAALVGVTLAVSVVAWRGPAACRIGAGAGAAAGVPGLLSGFACCGPTLLLVIGVQASAGLLAVMQWFLPLAVLGLVATLLWVGSRVDPAAVG